MLTKPHELDGRFEREAKTVTTCISDAALTSIAVSLKRIADALDGGRLDSLKDRVNHAVQRVYDLEVNLRVEIDRLIGPRPLAVDGAASSKEVNASSVGILEDGVGELHLVLTSIHEQVARLREL